MAIPTTISAEAVESDLEEGRVFCPGCRAEAFRRGNTIFCHECDSVFGKSGGSGWLYRGSRTVYAYIQASQAVQR